MARIMKDQIVGMPIISKMYGYTNQTVYKVKFIADAIVGDTTMLVQAPISCDDIKCIIVNHLPADYPGTVHVSVCNKPSKANYPEVYLGRFIQVLDSITVRYTEDKTSLGERVVIESNINEEKGE